MSGLDLMTKTDDFKTIRIKNVRMHSPADEAGLREGDAIMTINGRPAAGLDLDKLSKMFKQAGKEYLLTIKRDNKEISARLKMRRACEEPEVRVLTLVW